MNDKFKLLKEQLAKQKEDLIASVAPMLRSVLEEFVFEEDDYVERFFENYEEADAEEMKEKYRDMQHDMIQEIIDKVLI